MRCQANGIAPTIVGADSRARDDGGTWNDWARIDPFHVRPVEGESMRRLFSRFRSRALLASVALAVVLAAGWWAARWSMLREWRRTQVRYHAAAEGEHRDFERRLRGQIAELHRAGGDEQAVRDVTHRIFGLLRRSAIAANSREVESWRDQPPSPERTAAALRWADAAAEEARYHAALHATWRRDYERGGTGRHITDDEVAPFRMPAGWTAADLLRDGTGLSL